MSAKQEAVPRERLHVLVVDDNRDAADTLRWLLMAWGYKADVAYNGLRGLEVAKECQPDCLILDISMPGLDGYTLAARIREEPRLQNVKLIALTAYSGDEAVQRAKQAGFDYHLVKGEKPQAVEEILNMLEQVKKLAETTEYLAQQNIMISSETKDLLQEVKEDIREVKKEVKEIKEELKEVKKAQSENE